MAFAHPDHEHHRFVAFHARMATTVGGYMAHLSIDATPFNNVVTISPERGAFPGGIHVDRRSGRELVDLLVAALDFLDEQAGVDHEETVT